MVIRWDPGPTSNWRTSGRPAGCARRSPSEPGSTPSIWARILTPVRRTISTRSSHAAAGPHGSDCARHRCLRWFLLASRPSVVAPRTSWRLTAGPGTGPAATPVATSTLAHELLGSTVRVQDVAVEKLAPEVVGGTFDVVLFLGVLYHAPDPLGYLKRVRSVTGGVAIIETVVDLLDVPVPAAAYYANASLNNDGSNHFGPNPMAVEGLLVDAASGGWWPSTPGRRTPGTRCPRRPRSTRRPSSRSRYRLRHRFGSPRSGRMVFHAHVEGTTGPVVRSHRGVLLCRLPVTASCAAWPDGSRP